MAKFRLRYPDPSEDQFGTSVADLLHAILRPEEAAFTHIPVGGYYLGGAARGRLTRLGLTQGWPDIVIAYGLRRALWLELKTHTGSLSRSQKARHAQLISFGHKVEVCRRIEEVLRALVVHGVPFMRTRLAEGFYEQAINTGDAAVSTEELTEGTGAHQARA